LFDKSQSTLIQCPAGLAGTYVVPATVTNIVATAFVGCAGLTAINASTNSSSYSSSGGVLFDKAKSTVIQYPAGASGSYTIPSTVTHLGSYAFAFSPLLTGITIPATVQSVGLAAFAGCTGLTNLSIPDSVVSIGDEAFEACESLSQLSFGKGLTNIGLYAFFECTSLTNIVLPDGLTTLGDRAFESCSSVQTVTLGKNLSSIGSFTFGFCGNLTNVFAKGNAPSVGSATFPSGATVYRLYGTKGWSSTLSGVPTALWNPLIQTAALRPSLATNGFAFSYSGPTNLAVIVEFSSDLSKSKWTPVQTNILSGGAASFKALRLTNAPVGFYRIRCP
jgi:hypothetical protein